MAKTSARPWTPMPIGRWRRLEWLAAGRGGWASVAIRERWPAQEAVMLVRVPAEPYGRGIVVSPAECLIAGPSRCNFVQRRGKGGGGRARDVAIQGLLACRSASRSYSAVDESVGSRTNLGSAIEARLHTAT
eukprot:scaffold142255_cov30-Tisochrysis_lutea.AAC.2